MARSADLIASEPVFVPDVFATALVGLETIGGNHRLTFAVDRLAVEGVPSERVIVCHLVLAPGVLECLARIAGCGVAAEICGVYAGNA